MEVAFRQKLFYFFPVFFCFCLPFGSLLLSGIIICWTLTSFFNIERQVLLSGFKRPLLWLCYAFFFLTCFSALFSSDYEGALFAVEIKFSFILFPYLLFCFRYPRDIIKRCIVAFVSGCFFACLYLIVRAMLFSLNGHPEYFFYTLFSQFIHAGYFAMYLVLAIVFVVLLYGNWFRHQRAVIYSSWFFIAFFVTGIFLCSSKMGLISFFVCMPVLAFYRHRHKFRARGILFILAVVVVLFTLASVLFPSSFGRLSSLRKVSVTSIDKTSSESTAVRILIWHEAWQIVKGSWLLGVGAGDANTELYRAYERNGLTGALSHRLNAHNEFLQTLLGMGIAGLVPLLFLIFGEMVFGLRRRHFLLVIFTLLIAMNFMVESMLQASAGVLFFMFFLCVFNLVDEEALTAEPVIT